MASAATRAQQKAQKKKVVILVIMALATAMTWGKNLFGKDSKAAATPVAVAATPIPGAAGGAGPTPPSPRPGGAATTTASTSITSYDQAVQRMKTWPKALKRRVHVGQIEEILPFEQEVLDASEDDASSSPRAELVAASIADEVALEEPPEPQLSFADLRLKLTTTAILGKSRYARINGEKVTVGQVIEVQVGSKTIRYEVSAINPREVEIRYSGETYFLRITVQSLQSQAQDSA